MSSKRALLGSAQLSLVKPWRVHAGRVEINDRPASSGLVGGCLEYPKGFLRPIAVYADSALNGYFNHQTVAVGTYDSGSTRKPDEKMGAETTKSPPAP